MEEEMEYEDGEATILLYDDLCNVTVVLHRKEEGLPRLVFRLFSEFVTNMFEHNAEFTSVEKISACLIAYSMREMGKPDVLPHRHWGRGDTKYYYMAHMDERGITIYAYDARVFVWPLNFDFLREAHKHGKGTTPFLDWVHFDWRPRSISDGNAHSQDY